MKSRVVIRDEDAQEWLVCKGDPTWEGVAKLARTRTLIILPKRMIIRNAPVNILEIEVAIKKLSLAYRISGDKDLGEALKTAGILYDCIRMWYN
jgi:hypothetical protein